MNDGIVSRFAPMGEPNWSRQDTYANLLRADYAGCAEEWLRRNAEFQRTLKTLPCRLHADVSVVRRGIRYTRCAEKCPLSAFGVACCRADMDASTVFWLPKYNPRVLSVKATSASKKKGGRDLRDCSLLTGVLQKEDECLHLLFRDDQRTFHLAVHGVSHIDRPIVLQHSFHDLNGIRGNLDELETLYALYHENRLPPAGCPDKKFVRDQIRGMQALDGKKAGATYREIANVIFRGDKALAGQWEDCYRSRTQRVLRKAGSMADGMGYLSLLKRGKERAGFSRSLEKEREGSFRTFEKENHYEFRKHHHPVPLDGRTI